MRQEEKDKAIRTSEEILKKCDDSISMWTSLMNNDVSGFSKMTAWNIFQFRKIKKNR